MRDLAYRNLTAIRVRLGATKKGSPTGLKGTFDMPCKLNFRVGPDEEDGDKRWEEREGRREESKTSRIPGVRLKKDEYWWLFRCKRYQGRRDSTRPFAPHILLNHCRNFDLDNFTRGCTRMCGVHSAKELKAMPSNFAVHQKIRKPDRRQRPAIIEIYSARLCRYIARKVLLRRVRPSIGGDTQ